MNHVLGVDKNGHEIQARETDAGIELFLDGELQVALDYDPFNKQFNLYAFGNDSDEPKFRNTISVK
jgi:hypothetical protein